MSSTYTALLSSRMNLGGDEVVAVKCRFVYCCIFKNASDSKGFAWQFGKHNTGRNNQFCSFQLQNGACNSISYT